MDPQTAISIIIIAVISFMLSIIITLILRKIHRNLVFILPVSLTLFTAYLATYIFSGEGGLGAIFLVGFMGISGIAAIMSWIVALYSYFNTYSKDHPQDVE